MLALGSNAWGSPLCARSTQTRLLNHRNVAFFNVPKPSMLGRPTLKFGKNGGAPDNVALSWPFILLGELVFEREDDPPNIQGYHISSFSYIRQSLDILKSFILYFLWSKRCRMHFDG